MIDKAYEELTRRYSEIQEKLKFFKESIEGKLGDVLKEIWVEYEPKPVSKSFIAIDGGEFIKETRYGTVFVVNAEAVLSTSLEKNEAIDGEVEIGVLSPGNLSRERVSEIMSILEIYLALRNGDKADFILMDGSLIRKLGKAKDISGNEVQDLRSIIYLDDEKESYNQLIVNKQILMSRLIQKYGDKTLWISKNSRGKDIFKQGISDIAVLEALTQNSGYTKPYIRHIKSEDLAKNREVKILDGMEFTTFLTRLERAQKIIKVDVIGRIDEELIKEIMDSLYAVSVNGYPFPLLKVHYDVRVSKEDRNRILTLFNLKRTRGNRWIPSQFF